ncbi:hypothetical protein Btru_015750 [Bulinus truncatus]|nr:hypothetical protein Btru_015750 [Bulinus truncatus]
MKKESCFADFKIDVQYLNNSRKQVTFDENILQLKTYIVKAELLKLLNVEITSDVHPECLELVIITGDENDADHVVVVPNSDRLQAYYGLLSRCHLIKITHGRWSLRKKIDVYCSRVQDNAALTYYVFGIIFLVLAVCLVLWWY